MNGLQRLAALACIALTLGGCRSGDLATAAIAVAVEGVVADMARPLSQLPTAHIAPPAPPVVSEYAVTQLLNNAETDLVQAREGWSYSVPELWAATASRLDHGHRSLSEARTAIARAGTSGARADDLDKQLLQVKATITADAPRAFAAYDLLGQRNFFAAFPVTLDANALFREHPHLTQYLGADNARDARMLVAVYAGHLPSAKRAELEAAALNGPAERPVRPRPAERTNDVGPAVVANAVGPARVLVDIAGPANRLAFPVSIMPDGAQVVRREAERAFAEGINTAGDLIIAVSATSSRAQQRITSNETVQSEFRAGVRQVPNPAHQSAEASVARAQLAYQQALRAEA